jgi:hypothetical protein
MPNENLYADLMDQEAAGSDAQFRASASLAVTSNPDKVAQQRRVAGYLGMPPAAVEALPEQSEQQAKVNRLAEDTAQAPVLRAKYTDQDFSRLAHDDSDTLSAIEKLWSAAKDVGRYAVSAPGALDGGLVSDVAKAARAVVSGAPKAGAGLYGLAAAPFELVGLDHFGGFLRDQQKRADAEAGRWSPVDPNAGMVQRGVMSGLQSAGQNLLTMPLGLAAKSQSVMLGTMGAITGGQSYGKGRDAGLSPQRAVPYAVQDAVAEIVTEKFFGAAGFVERVKAGASAGKLFMYELAKEVPGEMAATLWQNFNEWANINPDKTVGEFLAEQPEALAETIVATLVGGTTQIGAVKGVERVIGRAAAEQDKAQQAERFGQTVEQLAALMAASKLRERAPESFNAFMSQLAESGETPSELYIDAEVLANTLNQSAITIEQLRAFAPAAAAQLEAHVPGADVRVPVAELTAAGPELMTPLLDHLRESEDAMSRAEAKQYIEKQGEKIRADVEQQLAEHENASAFQAEVQQAAAQFEEQLNAVGKFRPEVNKAYASLLGNFYAVQALRAGVPLADMLAKYHLRVAGKEGAGGQRLEQSVQTPEFRKWFAASAAVDDAGKPKILYHGTADDFTAFDPEQGGKNVRTPASKTGMFFVDRPDVAQRYAEMREGTQQTMPVYLSMQNPARMVAANMMEADALLAKGYEGDGAIVEVGPVGAPTQTVYAVKEATQIKSVFNNGQYDGTDPSILHQGNPEVRKVADELAGYAEQMRKTVDEVVAQWTAKPPRKGTAYADFWDRFQPVAKDATAWAKSMDRLTENKPEAFPPKGTITVTNDITAHPSVIALLKGADLSTFIHESGHFFLEVQADLAARIQAQISAGASVSEAERAIVTDMGKILAWFGIQGTPEQSALVEWLSMTLEQKREHHEKWARGFEKYVAEGKAPSQDLQALFSRFRSWLVSVYKTLKNLNVDLTPDVRAVMDRMLATDQAIAEAQAARAMGPFFQSPEQAGMTPEQYAEYHALAERATAGASAELDARLMKDMKWLSRARDKALKAAQAEVDTLRKEIEREVRAEVMSQPVYRAWQFLTGKSLRAEPGIQATETIDPLRQSGKLRTKHLKESYPEQWKILSERRMTSDENGMDPDLVAEVIEGFSSGDELVRALAEAPAPQTVIEEMTDARMLETHGDIASAQALAQAADEAVHSELRARVIVAELKALEKANKVKAAGDSLIKSRDTVDVMTQAAKEYADAVIASQKIKDLRPNQYTAAAARNGKLAEQALGKKTGEAAMHKRNQLINHFAARAALDAKQEVADAMAFFRKVISGAQDKVAKSRDFDVVQAARAILAEYGVGTKGEKAQKYLEAVERNDPDTFKVLRDRVDALTINAKPLAELTVEEFRGLEEEIRGLWFLAKRGRQIEVDGRLIDIEAAKIPLVERMEQIGIPERVPGEGQAVTDAERRLGKLQTVRAALRRVESWVGVKDGQAMGPFRRFIWQPIKDAADGYRADKAVFLKRYRDLLEGLDVGRERIAAPEIGYTFGHSRGGSGKAEILHAILHTGNASNQRKLLLGRGWATQNDEGVVDTSRWDAFVRRMIAEGKLTKADFDFAQGVWDLLEDMKPLAQKTHRDVFGRYFDEVTADAFSNEFGSYRGGYVPAMMDPEVVKDAATRALMEDENQTLAFAFPSTNKGFTKARVEYNQPLLLDLRALASHIDKVLLFSHMEQPIRDVRKVLASKEVSAPLHRIDPAAFDGLLTPWMNRAARQTVETKVAGDNGMMRFFSKARSRAGMAAMFANVVNTAQQITGLSIAAVKVRPALLLDAAVQWVKAPRQVARAVADASPYMATRMDNEVAHMTDAINEILLNPSLYESAQAWAAKHAYFMQAAVDNVIGPIVWTGAYNQAIEAGHPELDAKRLADAAVRETQGSTLPEDVSRIETGNAFVRMFVQFAGYFNMQANTLGTEFAKTYHELGLRKGMGRGLYVFTLGFLVPAMVSELIVQAFRGGPGDDDKDGDTLDDWLMAVLVMGNVRAALGMAPGAGQAANALINSFNRKPYDDRISTSPAVSMIESAVSAPHSVYKAVADDGNARKAVRDLATLITMTTGLPASAIARPAGYVAGMAQDKINPTSAADAARGLVTGAASPDSK